jgi:hypothetical protein
MSGAMLTTRLSQASSGEVCMGVRLQFGIPCAKE